MSRPALERLGADGFARLTAGAKLIGGSDRDPRLLELPDGRIAKLLRLKRPALLSWLSPPALRFRRNAERLAALGIPVMEVERTCHCPALNRQLVIYRKLEGEALATALCPEDGALWEELAEFVARLHRLGVYFRSLHLGNIIRLPQGGLGLIDILDLRIFRGPLGDRRRAGNFRHLLRRPEQRALFRRFGIERFTHLYAVAAALPERAERSLLARILRRLPD